jgi:hypothetical protein
VTPTQRPDPVDLTVVGNLAVLLCENLSGTGVAESFVAGQDFTARITLEQNPI